LAAPAKFGPFAQAKALDFAPLPGDPDQLVAGFVQKAGRNPVRMLSVMSQFALPVGAQVLERLQVVCRDTDLIVHSFLLTNAGYELARQQGIADISAQLFPMFSKTGDFPAVAFPDLPLGAAYRRLSHWLTTQIFWQGSRVVYHQVRRSHPRLPPLSGWPFHGPQQNRTPILYGFSPQVVAPPDDWASDRYVTGYWFLEPGRGWQPPERLLRFLDAGPAPLYVGFGSSIMRQPQQMAQIAIQALARTGQRGLLALANGALDNQQLPPHVYPVGAMPHHWLFPRTAAVVHHGGAGTTGAGLRAGVPNIVIPFTTDQPFWGRRVFRLGAGPSPIPASQLTTGNLAEAISQAVSDAPMRAKARALGRRIRQEDGTGRAVTIVEELRRRPPRAGSGV
jgi:sterol 3beta-glucosyltransferase